MDLHYDESREPGCSEPLDAAQEMQRQKARLREEVESVIMASRALEQRGKQLKKDINVCYKEQDAISSRVQWLEKEARDVRSMVKRTTLLSDDEKKSIQDELAQTTERVSGLRQRFSPQTGSVQDSGLTRMNSIFVRLMMGHVNVKVLKQGEKFTMKKEYEKFKGRTNWFLIVGGLLQLLPWPIFVPRHCATNASLAIINDVLNTLFQVFLLYYYITLALREHILQVNGSHIKAWWLVHHYLSIILSFLLLSWSPSPTRTLLMWRLALCITVQGAVQVLMHRYQLGRLYASVATGEARSMDVTGELMNPRFVPSLSFLLPFLLLVQLLQVQTGLLCWSYFYAGVNMLDEPHALLVGTMAVTLGIGNLSTTIQTYYQKSRRER